jgi:tyrosine-protein kinase Etk/Wzc
MTEAKKSYHGSDLETWRFLFHTVWSRKKTVAAFVGIVTVVMLVYVLFMPQSFTSTVTLLPPQQEKGALGLGSLLQGNTGLPMFDIGSSLGFGSRQSDIFAEILKSQSVAESLIIMHDLDRWFGVPGNLSHRHAIKPLQDATDIEVGKNGVVRVTVTLRTGFFPSSSDIDSVRNFAATLANDHVHWLDRINREKLISSARNSRMFVQDELRRTEVELDSAYRRLVAFQQENKSVFLEKQMEAALSGAASLREKLMQARAELGIKRQDFAEHSRVVEQLQAEIDAYARQYAALSTGQDAREDEFDIPFQRVPEVAREMAGYLRDVKTLEQVILFLSQQYYQDRVQEARDTPTVQVLDTATPAIQRSSPRRAVWMVMAVLFSTLVAVLYLMLMTWLRVRDDSGSGSS